ncbi:hypothetical protein [Bacteriovorax sp. Seq25_V]|uniref:hypothetical protein n=1 Tax=Bacteriovorax sp. Seq25_V TaxID=1201288 RepID=UPI00038A3A2F|nr:hypothetical protein [Bacteriovorax sp. Seq25_V]EQC44355.1 hypothetical protein M900_A0345 [Bacteriovorax sp. Seq25_V]
MISFFYSKLYSKKRLKNKFTLAPKDITKLAVSVNEEPLYGSFACKYTFSDDGIDYGCDYKTTDKKVDFTLSRKLIVKKYSDQRFQGRDMVEKLEKKKAYVIDHLITKFITKLETLTPEANPGEEKVIEWTRVSTEVLKRAIAKIDGIDTILQYKIFFTPEAIRIIAYNVDLELKVVNGQVMFKAFNYKDSKETNLQPVYNVLIKAQYNDLFNYIIQILKVIKEKEIELL